MACRKVPSKEALRKARRAVKRPQKAHAVTDAAVVYVVMLEVAKGALIFGGFATFLVVAVLFCLMED